MHGCMFHLKRESKVPNFKSQDNCKVCTSTLTSAKTDKDLKLQTVQKVSDKNDGQSESFRIETLKHNYQKCATDAENLPILSVNLAEKEFSLVRGLKVILEYSTALIPASYAVLSLRS